MPIYEAKPGTGIDFDGLTADTGLFRPANNTGGRSIQVRVNSISFGGPSAITDWTLTKIDFSDGSEFELLSDTTLSLSAGGPAGFDLLPTDDDGSNAAWGYKFVSNGITGDGVLKIDFDFVLTEG